MTIQHLTQILTPNYGIRAAQRIAMIALALPEGGQELVCVGKRKYLVAVTDGMLEIKPV